MKKNSCGCFVSIEGIEGAGKSTCLEAIRGALGQAGVGEPVITREPGGTELGEAVRSVLLDPRYSGMTGESEALLMFAARAELVAQVIQPSLDSGRWVVSDRFTDASYAYQGGGRGLGEERIAALEAWTVPNLRPDLTLLLDVEPEVGRLRLNQRHGEADRFEREEDDFFAVVREAYLKRAKSDAHRFRVIDATKSVGEVRQQVQRAVYELLGR
jgi:dTMP kinase